MTKVYSEEEEGVGEERARTTYILRIVLIADGCACDTEKPFEKFAHALVHRVDLR